MKLKSIENLLDYTIDVFDKYVDKELLPFKALTSTYKIYLQTKTMSEKDLVQGMNSLHLEPKLTWDMVSQKASIVGRQLLCSAFSTQADMIHRPGSKRVFIVDSKIYVVINKESLSRLVLDNLFRFDDFIEYDLKIIARHEVGHVIDAIINDGIPEDEFIERKRKKDEAFDKYIKYTNSDNSDADEATKLYYAIPNEAAANNIVGLTCKDIISMNHKRAKRHKFDIKID